MHLQKLSKDVECSLRGDESLEEIERRARSVIETDLIPDYREFRRQLAAERTRSGGRILDFAGKLFQIDAAPWTPKFYGQLLQALGVALLDTSSLETERVSNKSQAFQFMGLVEDTIV